jgi:hypothetical protein
VIIPNALTDGVPKVPEGCSEGFCHSWHLITCRSILVRSFPCLEVHFHFLSFPGFRVCYFLMELRSNSPMMGLP